METIPEEIILEVLTHIIDIPSILSVTLTSTQFNVGIRKVHIVKFKCLNLIKLLYYYNDQLEHSIFTRTSKYVVSISQEDIVTFKSKISLCDKELIVIHDEFRDKIIDALSEADLDKVVPYKDDGILKLAKLREVGDAFLCPNGAIIIGEKDVDDSEGRKFGNYGTSGGLLVSVECWIKNASCDVWSRGHHKYFGRCGIDEHLPAILFLGKKEGDTITFKFKGRDVKLYCGQLPHRYSHTNFQDTMREVVSSFSTCSPNYYSPPLSYDDQHTMFITFRDMYLSSI